MKNPIFDELIKLKLISKSNLIDLSNKTRDKKVEANEVDDFLAAFIGEKLIENEIEHFGINLSDKSLSKLIKHQKDFKRDNKFSRTEYEKFLLKSNCFEGE